MTAAGIRTDALLPHFLTTTFMPRLPCIDVATLYDLLPLNHCWKERGPCATAKRRMTAVRSRFVLIVWHSGRETTHCGSIDLDVPPSKKQGSCSGDTISAVHGDTRCHSEDRLQRPLHATALPGEQQSEYPASLPAQPVVGRDVAGPMSAHLPAKTPMPWGS